MSKDPDDVIPPGVCTALKCRCDSFIPNVEANAPMYCARKNCWHSIEWHHLPAKEIEA